MFHFRTCFGHCVPASLQCEVCLQKWRPPAFVIAGLVSEWPHLFLPAIWAFAYLTRLAPAFVLAELAALDGAPFELPELAVNSPRVDMIAVPPRRYDANTKHALHGLDADLVPRALLNSKLIMGALQPPNHIFLQTTHSVCAVPQCWLFCDVSFYSCHSNPRAHTQIVRSSFIETVFFNYQTRWSKKTTTGKTKLCWCNKHITKCHNSALLPGPHQVYFSKMHLYHYFITII